MVDVVDNNTCFDVGLRDRRSIEVNRDEDNFTPVDVVVLGPRGINNSGEIDRNDQQYISPGDVIQIDLQYQDGINVGRAR